MIVEDPFVEREDHTLRCRVCARRCIIKEGETGFCGIRKNVEGQLDLMVYSRPQAVAVDPIEKKPLFHFLPTSTAYSIGTYGCTLMCKFCQNWQLSQALREKLPLDTWIDLPPDRAIEEAKLYNCKVMAYTYNEPVIWFEYWRDIAQRAKKEGLRNVLVTCGYGTQELWEESKDYVDAANVDLKGFSKEFYLKYTGAMLQPVLDSIKTLKRLGKWVEVTTLVIPGANDDMDELRAAAQWLRDIDPEMPWHLTVFHPDYKMLDRPKTPVSQLIRIREMALDEGLKYVYIGNALTPFESTYCPNCGTKLIDREWFRTRITEDFDIEAGKCKACGHKIKGIWV